MKLKFILMSILICSAPPRAPYQFKRIPPKQQIHPTLDTPKKQQAFTQLIAETALTLMSYPSSLFDPKNISSWECGSYECFNSNNYTVEQTTVLFEEQIYTIVLAIEKKTY